MKKKEIFELVEKFQDTNISLLEYEDAEGRLRLEKGESRHCEGKRGPGYISERNYLKDRRTDEFSDSPENFAKGKAREGEPDAKPDSHQEAEAEAETDTSAGIEKIKAPLVGVFYRAANPGSKPFAEIGKEIKQGRPLCIIEAMKVMNEIKAPYDLIVRNIMGTDGEMVDCATEIFEVERC